MALALAQQLQESLADLGNFNVEKLRNLLQEMMKTFQYIQGKIDSKNPKEREEALQLALELKEVLDQHAQTLSQSVGMDLAQLMQLAENQVLFSDEERKALEQAKVELKEFEQQLKTGEPQTGPKLFKNQKSSKKNRILGNQV